MIVFHKPVAMESTQVNNLLIGTYREGQQHYTLLQPEVSMRWSRHWYKHSPMSTHQQRFIIIINCAVITIAIQLLRQLYSTQQLNVYCGYLRMLKHMECYRSPITGLQYIMCIPFRNSSQMFSSANFIPMKVQTVLLKEGCGKPPGVSSGILKHT